MDRELRPCGTRSASRPGRLRTTAASQRRTSNIEAGRKQPTEKIITAMAKRLGETKDSITYVIPDMAA